jgi:DNA-directed RNA polymerase subunit E"
MAKRRYVCRSCRRFTSEKECPACKSRDLSASWKGLVIINDPNESEIAQNLNIKTSGKYAIFVG